MKRYLFFSLFFFFIIIHGKSQISESGQPLSFKNEFSEKAIPVYVTPPFDMDALISEDAVDELAGDIPFRFGKDIAVNYTLENSGYWKTLENGDRIWLMSIMSEGAFSLNFIMDYFYLPPGARLFLYNENTKQYIGAFTNRNNNSDHIFATSPIAGDKITFELFEPKDKLGQSNINITYVIHAYKNIFGLEKDYGGSGSCNINVNCPQGTSWQNQKRAAAMILNSNNTRICSGAMVNNARQDGTPYFLTANHCLSGTTSNSWIFMFNYESPTCTNQNGPTNQTVQGSTIRAKGADSDFALLELSSTPPPNYNVFYAGWSAIDIASDSCVGIHHPSGDIKKITFDYDTVTSSAYSGAGNDHWRIGSWNLGTTEGGSSGSPLFDKNHRIVGQLHGGSASCSNPTGYDVYGKFAYSWNTGTTPATRLKDWLDPDDTGITFLDGQDFNTPQFALDAALATIDQPAASVLCELEVTPQITLRNNGAQNLTSAVINYAVNSASFQTQQWNGSLAYLEFTTVSLPTLYLSQGQQDLKIFISSPNGLPDENNSNDTLNTTFETLLGNQVTLTLKTDNYPEETSWKLLDSTGATIYTSNSLAAQTTHTDIFCLHNGCYDFVILDSYGDGMAGGGWWNPSPPGTYSISALGLVLDSGSGDFGFSDTLHFCVNTASIDKHINENNISLYPNPVKDVLNIYIENIGQPYLLEIYNLNGKLISEITLEGNLNVINTSQFHDGIYFLKISNNEIFKVEKMIITR
ncbi:MAG: T9SS type A sorting domain-containing protein [Bacteroidales bacterium]|nr:T9SS type A sorting domain-containing protein [Bacteroidales bacterium]